MTLVGELAQYFFLTKRQLAVGELAPIRRPVRANSPTASWRCAHVKYEICKSLLLLGGLFVVSFFVSCFYCFCLSKKKRE